MAPQILQKSLNFKNAIQFGQTYSFKVKNLNVISEVKPSVIETIKRFITEKTPKSITLENQFKQIKDYTWDNSMVIVGELNVQLGQLYSMFDKQNIYAEDGRIFNDVGDELSDILLNLINLARLEEIDLTNLKEYTKYEDSDLKNLIQLLGQISEAVLENNGYRFKKVRKGFATTKDFIKDRLVKMYLIVFNYAMENGIDLFHEFDKMYDDAISFVEKKVEEKEYGTLRYIRQSI